MSKLIDITGQRFGRLQVLSAIPSSGRGHHKQWLCRCDCGTEKAFDSGNLRNGVSKSCGCLRSEILQTRDQPQRTHGKTNTKEFRTWAWLKSRCHNKKSQAYKNYGGRGITVHPSWVDSFEQFLKDVGDAPSKKHSLDRIDNNLGYEPGNVRWTDWITQQNNRRSNTRIEYQGRTQTLAEWGRELNISLCALYHRSRKGWDTERMFTRPANRGWQEGDPGSIDKHAIARAKKSTT